MKFFIEIPEELRFKINSREFTSKAFLRLILIIISIVNLSVNWLVVLSSSMIFRISWARRWIKHYPKKAPAIPYRKYTTKNDVNGFCKNQFYQNKIVKNDSFGRPMTPYFQLKNFWKSVPTIFLDHGRGTLFNLMTVILHFLRKIKKIFHFQILMWSH